jgi:hypothetical protein
MTQFWVVGRDPRAGRDAPKSGGAGRDAPKSGGAGRDAPKSGGAGREAIGPFNDYDAAREAWAERCGAAPASAGKQYRIERIDPDEPPLCTD